MTQTRTASITVSRAALYQQLTAAKRIVDPKIRLVRGVRNRDVAGAVVECRPLGVPCAVAAHAGIACLGCAVLLTRQCPIVAYTSYTAIHA